jgi:cytidylate kinase
MITVTVSGPSKCGKTAVAVFLARQLDGLTKSVQLRDETSNTLTFQAVLDVLEDAEVTVIAKDDIEIKLPHEQDILFPDEKSYTPPVPETEHPEPEENLLTEDEALSRILTNA